MYINIILVLRLLLLLLLLLLLPPPLLLLLLLLLVVVVVVVIIKIIIIEQIVTYEMHGCDMSNLFLIKCCVLLISYVRSYFSNCITKMYRINQLFFKWYVYILYLT